MLSAEAPFEVGVDAKVPGCAHHSVPRACRSPRVLSALALARPGASGGCHSWQSQAALDRRAALMAGVPMMPASHLAPIAALVELATASLAQRVGVVGEVLGD